LIIVDCKLESEHFKGEESEFLPVKAYEGSSAGYDLRADIKEPVTIAPMERVLIPTAVKINIPDGYVGMVCPRSGIALKYGISVLNSPGIIDPGYINTIGVILVNLSNTFYTVAPKDKIAQLLFTNTIDTVINPNRWEGNINARGLNGFGSSGTN